MSDKTARFAFDCPGHGDLNTIYRNFAPYLYPFIIEFCILIVGIFYMIWANISRCPKKLSAGHGHGHDSPHQHHAMESSFTSLASIPEDGHLQSNGHAHPNNNFQSHGTHHAPPSEVSEHCKNEFEHENEYKSKMVLYADCHAASRGLFGKKISFISFLKGLSFSISFCFNLIAGMILMILTIVFIILFHVAVQEP